MRDWLLRLFGHRPGAAPGKDAAVSGDPAASALSAHDSGDWEQAVNRLRPLAAQRPDDAEVLYRLGDSLYQLDRVTDALPHLERAVQIKGDCAAYQYKFGNALKDLERVDEALTCYRRALALAPGHAQALNNAGTILEAQGEPEAALQHYRRAIAADATLQPALLNQAMLLHKLERFAEAVSAYQTLLQVDPRSVASWCNLGNAYVGLERLDEAIRSYTRALEVEPASALAFFRLGIVFLHQGKYQEAETAARRAVELAPDHVDGWISLGDVLQSRHRYDEALAAYRRGLDIDPNNASLLNNIGVLHKGRNALDTARQYFDRAIAAAPRDTLARMNRVGIDLAYGLVAEAIAGYKGILETDPGHEQAARQVLLTLLYAPVDVDTLFAEHRAFGERFASGAVPVPDWKPLAARGRKLRIGYVSSDLRRHPVGYNMAHVIQYLDRSAFEMYLYSHLKRPDDMTRRFQERADAWRSITYLSDRAAAEQMRQDRLDILVLLAGRFDENRPLLATHRPAPILVSMHDPATSGLREIDYLIADRNLVPRHAKEKFTERVVCLPTFYLHPPLPDAPPIAEPPAARNGFVTFGSFNNPAKINEDVVAVWARLLLRVPGSRLLLKYFQIYSLPHVRSRWVRWFRDRGIPEERLLFPGEAAEHRGQHLADYRLMDIALDSFPFSGSTTTFESLWMGVPVVTLAGDRMVSRWSAAMLKKVDLARWIARDAANYVEIAAGLAADVGALTALRAGLRDRVARSPLCAGPERTRQLERLFRRMWEIWLARQTPGSLQ